MIGFGSIGELNTTMTAKGIGEHVGVPVALERRSGQWAVGSYEGEGPQGTDTPPELTEVLSVTAESHGPTGPVDVLGFGIHLNGAKAPTGFPRTAAGIGTGSTLDQLRKAYSGEELEEEPAPWDEKATRVRRRGPGDLETVFVTGTDGVIEAISTGHAEQLRGSEDCEL